MMFFRSIIILLLTLHNAFAINIIRDAEIESVINEIANPIIKATKLTSDIKIYIVDNKEINAYATSGNLVFINHGLILKSQTPEMVAGVLAHEFGHIKAGHAITRKKIFADASLMHAAVLLMTIGSSLLVNSPEAVWALMVKGVDTVEKIKYRYTRDQEQAADMAAINFLQSAGYSPHGIIDMLKLTSRYDRIYSDLYARTHPFSMDRINIIKPYVGAWKTRQIIDPFRFNLAKAKLEAYLAEDKGSKLLAKIARKNDDISHYQKAIIYLKKYNLLKAEEEMQSLLIKYNNNPYFNELYAQILLEKKEVSKALEYMKKALNHDSKSPLLLTQHAILLLGAFDLTKESYYAKEAIKALERANTLERDYINFQMLARAYGYVDNIALAEYNLAEANFIIGDYRTARKHANRAMKFKNLNSKTKTRLADIVKLAE
ncbi:MAG: M48 family metalloprotease [Sphingobacteriia bacterium]|nr:M48 family metalloprotease [Sphingobacteriia bacterium]